MSNTSQLHRLHQKFAQFRRDSKGQVAVILGLAILPVMGFVGTAVDYSRGVSALNSLNAAADSAALNAVAKGRVTHVAPDAATVRQYFDASGALGANVQINSFAVTNTNTVTTLNVQVAYTAQVDTTFMNVFGIHQLQLSGSSKAATDLPPYIDFHLLLDNSPSMGVAGSTADITKMQSLTPDNCAFACHQKNTDGTDKLTDYYHVAKNNGVKTRIDLLRSAVQNLMDTATSSASIPNQFRMGIYTFSDTFQTVAGLSTNLATQKTKAAAIDLAYSYQAQTDQQTSFDVALPVMNSLVATPGDGMSATAPQKYVFFVTDGVQDEVKASLNACVTSAAGGGTVTNGSGNFPAICQLAPHDGSTTTISAINPSLCTTLKNRGVKVAVLYTPYLPLTVNGYYNQYVAPLSNTSASGIVPALTACASPGFFFQIDNSTSIDQAMNAMFQAAVKYARLVQ